ncbi:MAG: hypothetical protein GWP08_03915 [Nitrospiraceae bacterium]|nr:hypothetical protein [Nitrospiraceae bacterium]
MSIRSYFPKSAVTLLVAVTFVATLTGCPGLFPPRLVSVTPNVVPSTVATALTLAGRNFEDGATVTFTRANGTTVIGAVAATFVSSSELTVVSPTTTAITAAENVTVVVTNPGGKMSDAVTVVYAPPPSVATMAPLSVPGTIPTAVTVTGVNFESPAEVRFMRPDSTEIGTVSGTVVNANTITCTTAADAAIAADTVVTVEVLNPDGQVSISVVKAVGSITYLAPPIIDSIAPNPMRATVGESVTITGSNFDAASQVEFNLPDSGPTAAIGVSVNAGGTEITCTSPMETGLEEDASVTVTVTTPAPDGQSDTLSATYTAGPDIASVSPIELPTQFGLPTTVMGTGFQDGASITFGGTAGTGVAVASGIVLTCTSPPRPDITEPTAVDVVVTNPDGQVSDDTTKVSSTVTYYPPPIANTVSAASVPATISTELTITGQHFRGLPLPSAIGHTTVIFREAVAPFAIIDTVDAAVVGSTELTCMTPVLTGLLAPLAVTLEVVGPQGQGQSSDLLDVTYNPPPDLSAATFLPPNVPATIATPFTITGATNLNAAASGVDLIFTRSDTSGVIGTVTDTSNTGTDASGNTPTLAGLTADLVVQVTVRNNNDMQVSETFLTTTYNPPPSITTVLHGTLGGAEVPATIASLVTITGANFQAGATTSYNLPVGGATAGAPTVDSATQISDTSPTLASGDIALDAPVAVTVTNPDNQVSNAVSINYQAEPSITGVTTGITVADVAGDVIPATIAVPFDAVTANCLIDATNATGLGGGVPTVTFTIVTPPEALDATGVSCPSEVTLEGTTPGTFTNTDDQVAIVSITDAYGQPGTGTATITITAPPTLTEFQATFNDTYGPFTDRSVFPSTIASDYTLIGTNLRDVADVEFFEDSSLATSIGTDTAAISVVNTEVTGETPVIAPTPAVSLTDVNVLLTNTDGQSTATPLNTILAVAPPLLTDVIHVSGAAPTFIANGPFRNEYSGTFGVAVTFALRGTNLDSRSPDPLDLANPGAAFVSLGGGAVAIDGLRGPGDYASGGGDDAARIMSSTAVRFELQDNGNTDSIGSALLADVLGDLDVLSLTDYTGQTTTAGVVDAMLTVRGPATDVGGEGHAAALVTGNLDGPVAKFPGDEGADLAVLTTGPAGARVDIFYGTTDEALPIDPDQTSAIPLGTSAGLTTIGSRNMLITDFDGDGYGDLFVGIPDNDLVTGVAGAGTAGAVHVWFGSDSGISAAGPDVTLDGAAALNYGAVTGGEGFGAALASGDFNGDGLADLAVGAPGQLGIDGTATSSGVVHLYLGNVDGLTSAVPDISFAVAGSNAGGRADMFGLGLALGDVDGDGDDDLFAGSPGFDGLAGFDTGRIWMFEADSNLDAAADQTITGTVAGVNAAYPSIVDVNGDALADLLVGAPVLDGDNGQLVLFVGQLNPATGTWIRTAGGDSALVSAGTTGDTFGTGSGTMFIDMTNGILASGANITDVGGASGFADRYTIEPLKAFTFEFIQQENFPKPEDLGFDVGGEQFAAYLDAANIIDTDESAVDVFLNIQNAVAGMRDGFLVVAPSPKLVEEE